MWFDSLLAWLLGVPLITDSGTNLTISTDCPLSFDYEYPQCPNWAQREFDFIIVGAGTAGSTLANRLSENSDWNVLLVEAGGVPSNLSEIPGLFEALQKTPEDWSFQAQDPKTFRGYKNSVFSMAKGKVLGGSSTINTMALRIGAPEDYDHWAELGNVGWNWLNVTKYFDKVDETIKTTDYTSTSPFRNVLGKAVEELGIDPNSCGGYGYKDAPIQTYEGQRYSQAKAYLQPIKDRKNLCVVTEKIVTGLWFTQNGTIQGVTINDSPTISKRIKATKEVILSAGAINTPKLLMLSGIGPRGQLQKLGIPTKVNLPVGQNFMDHMVIPIMLQGIMPDLDFEEPVTFKDQIDIYCSNKTGSDLSTIGISNYQGYINTGNSITWSVPNQLPNVELLHYGFNPQEPILNITLNRFGFMDDYQNQLKKINSNRSLLIILINILHPKSRGSIELEDTHPLTPPKINPNFLSHPDDIKTILQGVQFVERLLQTWSLSGFSIIDLGLSHCSQFEFGTPTYWECYSRTFAMSIFHASGTCKMGNDSSQSVVNPRLQIWGQPKIRVVDSSIMPELITGHTNFPVGMIAEKAADIIKEDYQKN